MCVYIENEIGPTMCVVYADKNKTGLKASIGGAAAADTATHPINMMCTLCALYVCL